MTQGITQVFTAGVPSSVSAASADWVTLAQGPRPGYATVALARSYGQGRVLATSLDWIGSPSSADNAKFTSNVVKWLSTNGKKRVYYSTGHKEILGAKDLPSLNTAVSALGLTLAQLPDTITSEALADATALWVSTAWGALTPAEVEAIRTFVDGGGGLLGTGLGWSWVIYNPGQSIGQFPMNVLFTPFGAAWRNDTIDAGDNAAPGGMLVTSLYPNITQHTPSGDLKTVSQAHLTYGHGLPAKLQSDQTLRNSMSDAYTGLATACAAAPQGDPVRQTVTQGLDSLLTGDSAWFYKRGFQFNPPTEGAAAYFREQFWLLERTCSDLTQSRKDALIQMGAMDQPRAELFQHFGIVVLDNDGLSSRQWSYLHSLFSAVPLELYQLPAISVMDMVWSTAPTGLPANFGPATINIFGQEIGKGSNNPFPSEVPAAASDIFMSTVAHELNHVVDSFYIAAQPEIKTRRDALIQQAGSSHTNYLRSTLPDGFFVASPQEFFASISNQYFTDTERTFQLGVERLKTGNSHPIEQFLFFADVYARGGEGTIGFISKPDGAFLHFLVGGTRDPQGRTNSLTFGSRKYTIQYSGSSVSAVTTADSNQQVPTPDGAMPQLAFGSNWKTSILLNNTSTSAQSVRLRFWNDSGTPLTVPLIIRAQSSQSTDQSNLLDLTLPANGSVTLETGAAETLQTGWVAVEASDAVTGFGVFSQTGANGGVQEATVPLETRQASAFLTNFDLTSGYATGLAVANHTGAELSLEFIARGRDGAVIASTTFYYPAHAHGSFELGSNWPDIAGRTGTLEVRAAQPGSFSMLGLRFHPQGSFTTLPVIPK